MDVSVIEAGSAKQSKVGRYHIGRLYCQADIGREAFRRILYMQEYQKEDVNYSSSCQVKIF